jgi:hypothetical protein
MKFHGPSVRQTSAEERFDLEDITEAKKSVKKIQTKQA